MRRHGCEWPLNHQQVGAAVLYLALALMFHAVSARQLRPTPASIAVHVADGAASIVVIVAYFVTSLMDPTDPRVLHGDRAEGAISAPLTSVAMGHRRAPPKPSRPRRSPSPFAHDRCRPFPAGVAGSKSGAMYCSHCKTDVGRRSKHCKICDRCVDIFDHHCAVRAAADSASLQEDARGLQSAADRERAFSASPQWLNNCIGRRNYNAFYTLIWTVFLQLILQASVAAAAFGESFADGQVTRAVELVARWSHAQCHIILVLRLSPPAGPAPRLGSDCHASTPVTCVTLPSPSQSYPVDTDQVFAGSVSPNGARTLLAIAAVLAGGCAVPIGELVALHWVLRRKHLTTFEYIIAARDQREAEALRAEEGRAGVDAKVIAKAVVERA